MVFFLHLLGKRQIKNVLLLLHLTQRPNNTSRSPFRTSRPKVEFNLTVYKIVSTIPPCPPYSFKKHFTISRIPLSNVGGCSVIIKRAPHFSAIYKNASHNSASSKFHHLHLILITLFLGIFLMWVWAFFARVSSERDKDMLFIIIFIIATIVKKIGPYSVTLIRFKKHFKG